MVKQTFFCLFFSLIFTTALGCGDAGNRVIHVREGEVPDKSAEQLQKEAEADLPSVWEIPITSDRMVSAELVCKGKNRVSIALKRHFF